MKKVFLVTSIFCSVFFTTAQQKEKFTAEQKAELKTKQLTLILDLEKTQEDKIYQLQLNTIQEHQKRKLHRTDRNLLSGAQKYELKKQSLDRKIEIKRKYKSILTEKQYEKWEKMQFRKAKKRRLKK